MKEPSAQPGGEVGDRDRSGDSESGERDEIVRSGTYKTLDE